MIRKELWGEIRPDDFAPGSDFRVIVETEGLGVKALLTLMSVVGKSGLYLSERALTTFKHRFIRENRTRYTPRELARMLDLSEGNVYSVLREIGAENANQVEMFADGNDDGNQ